MKKKFPNESLHEALTKVNDICGKTHIIFHQTDVTKTYPLDVFSSFFKEVKNYLDEKSNWKVQPIRNNNSLKRLKNVPYYYDLMEVCYSVFSTVMYKFPNLLKEKYGESFLYVSIQLSNYYPQITDRNYVDAKVNEYHKNFNLASLDYLDLIKNSSYDDNSSLFLTHFLMVTSFLLDHRDNTIESEVDCYNKLIYITTIALEKIYKSKKPVNKKHIKDMCETLKLYSLSCCNV